MKPPPLSDDLVRSLRGALLDHYDTSARDLPWRRDTEPYRVLVSEFMLQQTRVETVRRYYEPWLERFPTVEDLARADEDDVLKAWEGLGYYRRARNLHRAARVVAERHGGAIPEGPTELRALPGVGEYTAGAVASIAFDRAEPAVDGNVRRVFARLFDVADPKPAWLRARGAALVDPERPGDWNQALMELGATVCTPRRPDCPACPVARWCEARRAGTAADRPAPPKKRAVPSKRFGLGVFRSRGRVLLARRPDGGLLAGMWAFPEVELAGGPGDADGADGSSGPAGAHHARFEGPVGVPDPLIRWAHAHGLAPTGAVARLTAVDHRFTHLQARYLPWLVDVRVADPLPADAAEGLRWVGPEERGSLALPVAQAAVFEEWTNTPAGAGAT